MNIDEMAEKPGSPAAVRMGCICSKRINRHGEGAAVDGTGKVLYLVTPTCKMHKEKP